MSSSNGAPPSKPPPTSRKRSVDALLTAKGKQLKVGESVAIRLVKGPNGTIAADPVDPAAPPTAFPLLAKFPVSVVQPNFDRKPWEDARLYQQDVPKPTDDSDDEGAGGEPKKRWKYSRNKDKIAKRQWILQEQVDFLETMVARREKRTLAATTISTRYEGLPEYNSSHYMLLSSAAGTTTAPDAMEVEGGTSHDDDDGNVLQVRILPEGNSTVTFAQPASRQSMTLSQAEQAINDKTAGVRTILRTEAQATGTTSIRIKKKPNAAKNRLLSKLEKNTDVPDEGDDVMADVAFRKRKGGSGGARRELLGMADGVKVSDDGVLGGTNDQAFGGRNRFVQVNGETEQPVADKNASGDAGTTAERGADGAAMADDFYQRDVKAEYEELDYDANEQFDDDDVDLGESEMVVDSGGYGEDDEEDEIDELDADEEAVGGAEGLASVAGFKAMLAKARGEAPVVTEEGAANGTDNAKMQGAKQRQPAEKEVQIDHMSKISAAVEKSAQVSKSKGTTGSAGSTAVAAAAAPATAAAAAADAASSSAAPAAAALQVDENGLRVVSLDAIRREIWLNHGSIPMKRLMKMFTISKKSSAERQAAFKEIIKELCTMKNDPVGGRLLVLKQHWSNMG